MIALRRFTPEGIARFEAVLDEIEERGDANVDAVLLDDSLTERLSDQDILEVQRFESRLDAGRYLYQTFRPLESKLTDLERDRGLWTWLGGAWIDMFAPLAGGRRVLKGRPRWVLYTDHRKYYRHILAGPYRIYRAHRDHPENAMALLANPVAQPGELVEQFASRQQIVSNPNLLQAITRLYYDHDSGKLKRGHGGKGPGSPRRLAQDILPQFDLTWDIYGMHPDEILALLPAAEFKRFL
jgi:hypothetical protein